VKSSPNPPYCGVDEEAPDVYKEAVVEAADQAMLSREVLRLETFFYVGV
jgi:hypothetical protein